MRNRSWENRAIDFLGNRLSARRALRVICLYERITGRRLEWAINEQYGREAKLFVL